MLQCALLAAFMICHKPKQTFITNQWMHNFYWTYHEIMLHGVYYYYLTYLEMLLRVVCRVYIWQLKGSS